jgi:hypothetical protein
VPPATGFDLKAMMTAMRPGLAYPSLKMAAWMFEEEIEDGGQTRRTKEERFEVATTDLRHLAKHSKLPPDYQLPALCPGDLTDAKTK